MIENHMVIGEQYEVERYCDKCSQKIDDIDDRFYVADEYYCETCFDDAFMDEDAETLCEVCGDNATYLIDGVYLCEDCAKRRYRE